MSGAATRATAALDGAGATYMVHRYDVSEKVGDGYGEAVAAAIGMGAARVFKTLVAEVDDELVVAVIPVNHVSQPRGWPARSVPSMARWLHGRWPSERPAT